MIQQPSTSATTLAVTRLNPLALAVGFGVAGVVLILVFGIVMGSLWGVMGGGGMMGGGGWMHGSSSGSPGYGGGSPMGGGVGFLVSALLSGFLGGFIAGGTTAWVYNAVIARKT
ncbi:MAG: hypothetical protein ABI064_05065 [Acidobacteriaceae bacterium]